ncbi:MAG: S8 family serine peptidase, partial [Anaerolineales bacterium]|nr:S8 family serine peptidase [Anaerolineales bacterium]
MSLGNTLRRIGFNGLVAASLLLSTTAPALAQTGSTPRPERAIPQTVLDNKLDQPVTEEGVAKLSPALRGLTGRVEVVVRLTSAPTTVAAALGAAGVEQQARSLSVTSQQDTVLDFARGLDANVQVLGRTRVVLNAVMLSIDAAALPGLAAHGAVATIRQVANYTTDTAENAAEALSAVMETVPYIGARPEVQAAANGGAGVKVAVLDSGIDYTHVAFGGAGTLAAYHAAYGTATTDPKNTTRDGLFPTARVVEGYDFVGEVWPNGPLAPDEDPIDCGNDAITDFCDGGHGTHVADIIGGAGGVAPNVDLYAVRVCSAVATSCSGVAMIQGLEYAADPNGDGNTSDHVDIVNMSLGQSFGQAYEDDSSLAANNLADVGVLVVASAGNSADRPYIVGTPS